jgi:salicylate hydroxylase
LSDLYRPAIVAGGGIAGLSAALALAHNGRAVRVLERAEVFDEFGAGLQLSPNATGILRGLGVLDRLADQALHPRAIRIWRGHDGQEISCLPLTQAEGRWGAPYLVAHRADLHRALLEQVAGEPQITVTCASPVRGYEQDAQSVTVTAGHGPRLEQVSGCLLLAADGLRSSIRQRLLADGEPSFAGRSAWRGLVEARELPAALRLPEVNLWLGRDAHVVHYPLRGMGVVNIVAVIGEDGPGDAPVADAFALQGDARIVARRFARWSPPLRTLIESVDSWRKWPLFERKTPRRLTDRRVALAGDAAHPMLPHLAQGAAQAIEDAHVLAQQLAGADSVVSALERYGHKRRRRLLKINAQAGRLGQIYHLSGPAAMVRDVAIQLLGPERMLARYDWLYRFSRT